MDSDCLFRARDDGPDDGSGRYRSVQWANGPLSCRPLHAPTGHFLTRRLLVRPINCTSHCLRSLRKVSNEGQSGSNECETIAK